MNCALRCASCVFAAPERVTDCFRQLNQPPAEPLLNSVAICSHVPLLEEMETCLMAMVSLLECGDQLEATPDVRLSSRARTCLRYGRNEALEGMDMAVDRPPTFGRHGFKLSDGHIRHKMHAGGHSCLFQSLAHDMSLGLLQCK